jgi:V/A-type H+-transporting ATPase subunit C
MAVFMKIRPASDYIFAVAKIRTLEKHLIGNDAFEQAEQLESGAALRLLAEAGQYGDALARAQSSGELEAALENSLSALKRLIHVLLLDRSLWPLLEMKSLQDMAAIFQDYPNLFINDYIRHLIDMHNIKTYLRLLVLNEPQPVLEKQISLEGFISKHVFLQSYSSGLGTLVSKLKYILKRGQIIDYSHYFQQAMEKAMNEKSFAALERSQADFLITQLSEAKRVPFGPEPVLAYYFARSNEISLIRLLILGKMNSIAADKISERFNAAYA